MTDWTTHAAMVATTLGVLALEQLRARRKERARSRALPVSIAPLETHLSSDGLRMAEVFQDVGLVLRVETYAKQDDGAFGRHWSPIATSFVDREALPGVLRDALNDGQRGAADE